MKDVLHQLQIYLVPGVECQFCKILLTPFTDFIEKHNCHNQLASKENTTLDLIELYIQ